ncbi:hypothetical protein ABVB18_04140 [Xanthomonas citri pv. mangiferaeindicae]|nr:hypothetical protein [Xanthomonas citri]UDI80504.1 transposase [Xanthomonas citri pv. mangiferaeindicae]
MSINAVQFQAGLSMPEFFAFYGTEAKWRVGRDSCKKQPKVG